VTDLSDYYPIHLVTDLSIDTCDLRIKSLSWDRSYGKPNPTTNQSSNNVQKKTYEIKYLYTQTKVTLEFDEKATKVKVTGAITHDQLPITKFGKIPIILVIILTLLVGNLIGSIVASITWWFMWATSRQIMEDTNSRVHDLIKSTLNASIDHR